MSQDTRRPDQKAPQEKVYHEKNVRSFRLQKFNFCSAHFLLFADGTREELHGHNYRVWVDVDAPIGKGDIVIDFLHLKPIVKELCDSLDHLTLLPTLNPHLKVEEKMTSFGRTTERTVLLSLKRASFSWIFRTPRPNASRSTVVRNSAVTLRNR